MSLNYTLKRRKRHSKGFTPHSGTTHKGYAVIVDSDRIAPFCPVFIRVLSWQPLCGYRYKPVILFFRNGLTDKVDAVSL
jgi:hypothetical protein